MSLNEAIIVVLLCPKLLLFHPLNIIFIYHTINRTITLCTATVLCLKIVVNKTIVNLVNLVRS